MSSQSDWYVRRQSANSPRSKSLHDSYLTQGAESPQNSPVPLGSWSILDAKTRTKSQWKSWKKPKLICERIGFVAQICNPRVHRPIPGQPLNNLKEGAAKPWPKCRLQLFWTSRFPLILGLFLFGTQEQPSALRWSGSLRCLWAWFLSRRCTGVWLLQHLYDLYTTSKEAMRRRLYHFIV